MVSCVAGLPFFVRKIPADANELKEIRTSRITIRDLIKFIPYSYLELESNSNIKTNQEITFREIVIIENKITLAYYL